MSRSGGISLGPIILFLIFAYFMFGDYTDEKEIKINNTNENVVTETIDKAKKELSIAAKGAKTVIDEAREGLDSDVKNIPKAEKENINPPDVDETPEEINPPLIEEQEKEHEKLTMEKL